MRAGAQDDACLRPGLVAAGSETLVDDNNNKTTTTSIGLGLITDCERYQRESLLRADELESALEEKELYQLSQWYAATGNNNSNDIDNKITGRVKAVRFDDNDTTTRNDKTSSSLSSLPISQSLLRRGGGREGGGGGDETSSIDNSRTSLPAVAAESSSRRRRRRRRCLQHLVFQIMLRTHMTLFRMSILMLCCQTSRCRRHRRRQQHLVFQMMLR
jgi:hypothetical protein